METAKTEIESQINKILALYITEKLAPYSLLQFLGRTERLTHDSNNSNLTPLIAVLKSFTILSKPRGEAIAHFYTTFLVSGEWKTLNLVFFMCIIILCWKITKFGSCGC